MICKATFRHIGKDGKLRESPCGKCWVCLVNKRKQWTFRAKQELKNSYSSAFLTLSYSDDYITSTGEFDEKGNEIFTLVKKDLKAFLNTFITENRRYNNAVPILQKYGFKYKKITYYAIGEYGGKFCRPHYHVLIFNFHPDLKSVIEKKWSKGFVDIRPVNGARINYVTSYVITGRKDFTEKENHFALISKGFGKDYISTVLKMIQKDQELFIVNQGKKQALPQYYKRLVLTTPELKQRHAGNIEFENVLRLRRYALIDECEKRKINPFKYETQAIDLDKQKYDQYTKKMKR